VLDRTIREKTAVEKELERLYAEGAASNGDSTPTTVEQLTRRVQTTERERDEALAKHDSVVNEIARTDLLYVSAHLPSRCLECDSKTSTFLNF